MSCKLSREILLVAPRKKVWETYRDRLPEIVKSMKSIDEIQEIKRIKENEGFRIKNKWKIASSFPKSVQKIAPANLLTFYDTSFWDESSWTCSFVENPVIENGVFKCTGKNVFDVLGSKTRLTISFDLIIYPEKIPLVPRILRKGIASKLEALISDELIKNLTSTAKYVEEFIQQNK